MWVCDLLFIGAKVTYPNTHTKRMVVLEWSIIYKAIAKWIGKETQS